MSYFNNGSGAEVLEENNYYPFGLKHEGYNALAGNPSYQQKYNRKELQTETGWLDYGWRQYMPEIGKWNGMDQLSEKYYSISPFAYVANNPITYADFDGRWFNEDGSINTSGTANSFVNTKAFMTQSFGQFPGQGGGGGGYTFTGNAAGSMFNYFANGGDINGISFNNGYAIWSSLDNASNSMYKDIDDMMTGDTGGVTLNRVKIGSDNTDWYGPGGKGNWFFGTTASSVGFVEGSFRLTNGVYNGSVWSPKYYPSAWTGGSRARISTYNFGKIGRTLGTASFFTGVALDGVGVMNYYDDPSSPNVVHPGKAGINTVMGYIGWKGGVYGAIIATLYFGVDNFYPGGWVGASETATRTEVQEQATTGHPFLNNSAIKF